MDNIELLTIIIPSTVTILGFVFSYLINKRDSSYRIHEQKTEKQLSDLYGVQKDVLNLIDKFVLILTNHNKNFNEFNEIQERIQSLVICAGSEDAVKIIVKIRELYYSFYDDDTGLPFKEIIALYVLLAMQIKYDTTGIKTSPNVWYKGKYTTQTMLKIGPFYEDSVDTINNYVEIMKLNPFLKIDI